MFKNNKGTVLVVAVTAMMIMIIIGAVCLQIYTNQSLLDTYDQIRMRTFYSAEAGVEMMRGYINQKLADTWVSSGSTQLGDKANSGRGFLYDVTKTQGLLQGFMPKEWEPFKDGSTVAYAKPLLKEPFDGTMHPKVTVDVKLRRLTILDQNNILNNEKIVFINDITLVPLAAGDIFHTLTTDALDYHTYRGYEIVSTATAEHKTTMGVNTISTTLRYYFYTREKVDTDPVTGNQTFNHFIFWVGWRKD